MTGFMSMTAEQYHADAVAFKVEHDAVHTGVKLHQFAVSSAV